MGLVGFAVLSVSLFDSLSMFRPLFWTQTQGTVLTAQVIEHKNESESIPKRLRMHRFLAFQTYEPLMNMNIKFAGSRIVLHWFDGIAMLHTHEAKRKIMFP